MANKKKVDLELIDNTTPNLDDRLASMMNMANKQSVKWGLPSAVSIPAYQPQQFQRRVFSTGLTSLDSLLKIGGYPRGCIVELFGPPHAGKTLHLYNVIAEVQHQCMQCEGEVVYSDLIVNDKSVTKMVPILVHGEHVEIAVTQRTSICKSCHAANSGGLFVLADQENSSDPVWMQRQGIELTKLLILKLPTGEHATELLRSIMIQHKPDAIGIDSIAQLQPKTEQMKSEVDDSIMPGLHAKVMARLCRQVTSIFLMDPLHAPLIIWVNQIRADMTGYNKDVVTGGFAPEHYSAIRIKFSPKAMVNKDRLELGRNGILTIKKCKVAEGLYNKTLDYVILPSGFDRVMDLYITAVSSGVFLRSALISGGHYYAEDTERVNKLANKKDEAIELLRTDSSFSSDVRNRILNTVSTQVELVYLGDHMTTFVDHPIPTEEPEDVPVHFEPDLEEPIQENLVSSSSDYTLIDEV